MAIQRFVAVVFAYLGVAVHTTHRLSLYGTAARPEPEGVGRTGYGLASRTHCWVQRQQVWGLFSHPGQRRIVPTYATPVSLIATASKVNASLPQCSHSWVRIEPGLISMTARSSTMHPALSVWAGFCVRLIGRPRAGFVPGPDSPTWFDRRTVALQGPCRQMFNPACQTASSASRSCGKIVWC